MDTPCGKEPRKTEDQQINQAFRYIIENRDKAVDKTASESYLRNVLRYKVLNSDERRLELKEPNKLDAIKSSQANNLNGSIKKLSLLGKPLVRPSMSLTELPTAKSSPRELLVASEEQEDQIIFFPLLI